MNISLLSHPIAAVKIADLRNTLTQGEQFRKVLSDLTTILAIYATQDLEITRNEIETPLEGTNGYMLKGNIAVAPVLRAGLGMVDSFLNLVPTAVVSHIGLARDEQSLEPSVYYSGSGLKGISRCYVLDPMLATGGSAVEACSIVKKWDVKQRLAVYLNYEKEMAKITANPNLEEISKFAWGYTWAIQGDGASIYYCEKEVLKRRLTGGECIVVDERLGNTSKNLLKPNH